MANYGQIFSQATVSSSFKSAGYSANAASGTIRRQKLYDLLLGTTGTPADNVLEFNVSRITAAGTATGVTPNPLDPADAASAYAFASNATVEPTVTASSSLLDVGLNQRASYRWVAAPGSELVVPASASNGLAIRVLSPAYTSAAGGAALIAEQ